VSSADCPPLADRITKSLLGYGVIAGPFYVVTAAVQALCRDGFDPTRHAVSQLANGAFGWVQIVNFILTGIMTIAGAVGIGRALRPGRLARWAAALLAVYGLGLIAAGILRADPSDGFPPGTASGVARITWHGTGHLIAGGIGFACFVAAGFVIGAAFAGMNLVGWAWISRLVAFGFGAAFVFLATGAGGAVAYTLFTAAVIIAWAWLSATSAKLYPLVGTRTCPPGSSDSLPRSPASM
jgi:hypothetical protein